MNQHATEPRDRSRRRISSAERPTERSCPHCTYGLTDPTDADNFVVCANHPESPGQLRRVPAGGACRNFRRRRPPLRRLEPPTPPNDAVRYIPLTQGKFAIVDAADYEQLSQYNWYAWKSQRGTYYAYRKHRGRTIIMHRVITHAPDGFVVDHIDGNGLNNRRCNLRVCTTAQNNWNTRGRSRTSQYKGVRRQQGRDKCEARITVNGRQYRLGSFDDEIEAAIAYDLQAVTLAGPFAYLNFPHLIARTTQGKRGGKGANM